jgi:hypothetical protein
VIITKKKKVFSGMAFSDGWLTGFLKRKNLSLRQATKKAQVVLEDYKEKIVNWLQFNRRAQAKFNFELSEIANMDQTPIAFELLDNKTYNTKGIKTVFVKQTSSGWNRRQATLQILVHADGIQRCRPLLIFHGKNQDYRQKPKWSSLKQEYKLYNSRVEVMFNPKAWSNAELMVEWIKHLYTPSTHYPLFPRPQQNDLLDYLLLMCLLVKKRRMYWIVLNLLDVLHLLFLVVLQALFKSVIQ